MGEEAQGLMDGWVSWAPPWAKHPTTGEPTITASHEAFRPMAPDPSQKIKAVCNVCGTVFQFTCTSGNPRTHIGRFALTHQTEHYRATNIVPPR